MMKPIRIETTSANGNKLNLEALYQIAPSCFTEVLDGSDKQHEGETITVEKDGRHVRMAINFKTLRQLLGDAAVEDSEEMYQFTWPGKQAARYEAATPIADTLRPVPEDSSDWDTTENLYIEGDNLRVLKLLQRGYMGKVKMIYIDPPYNTGNDFVYHDDFKTSLADEELAAGNIDEEGLRYRRNLDNNGRFHSDWCSMMYSRLLVARSLLTEDGVIFISIDDHEVHNLRKVCDEVFGERNFVAEVSWHRNYASANDAKTFSNVLDYIIIYRKEEEFKRNLLPRTEKQNHLYKYDSNDGKGKWRSDNLSVRTYSAAYDFPIINPNTGVSYIPPKGRSWMTNKETIKLWIDEGRIFFGQKGDGAPQLKRYLSEVQDGVVPITYWSYDECGHNDEARKEIKVLFDGQPPFDSPKPTRLLLQALRIGTSPDSLVLDFFSGSATTAHAVMQLNAEDGGNRRYICVQIAEDTPEDSEARKAGYKNICEIGKERIRRAGKKIKEESPLTAQHLDTGFRVFRLAASNYEDVTKQPGEYDQRTLDLFADNIKADRTDLDLLFGAMLSWGVQLSLPMTTEEVDGCKIYTVDGNSLVACFAENITENVAKAMADKLPVRVLFRDSCFSEDKTKINIIELFKQKLNWDDKEAKENIRVI